MYLKSSGYKILPDIWPGGESVVCMVIWEALRNKNFSEYRRSWRKKQDKMLKVMQKAVKEGLEKNVVSSKWNGIEKD